MVPTAPARFLRLATLALCLALAVVFAIPAVAHAQEPTAHDPSKVVRVGWFASSFNTMDQSGRRSGYGYEYQLKVAGYTGWTYEYVDGSWSELLEMLERGDIDLMSDVSYTDERAKRMLFPDLPMGTEEYFLFVAPDNHDILSTDFSTLNGKKVGVNKGSIRVGCFNDWAKREGVKAKLVEVTCTEEESLKMLESGELDAYVTVDSSTDPDSAFPVCKIGSSDFFFAVSKDRPELLADLNSAMSKIQDESRFYNERMFEKHFKRIGANAYLAPDEVEWLASHGTIRLGYQDNYLAFCAADKQTGKLTGALKDYLDYASNCLANAHLNFEATAYPTAAAAVEALNKGEVDCVFPANLGGYDGEALDVVMTPAFVNSDMYALVRLRDQDIFSKKEHVIVAVNEGNPNYDAFLLDNYPNWRKVYYPNTES